jgi:hypothetical protein
VQIERIGVEPQTQVLQTGPAKQFLEMLPSMETICHAKNAARHE